MTILFVQCDKAGDVEPVQDCMELPISTRVEDNSIIWNLGAQEEWENELEITSDLQLSSGFLKPLKDSAYLQTKLKKFGKKHFLKSIRLSQSADWESWRPIPKATPSMAVNAPVFISIADNDYWLLAEHMNDQRNGYHAWYSNDMSNWTHYGPVTTSRNKWVTTAEYVDGKFYIYFDKPNDEDPHLIIDSDLTDGRQGREVGLVFEDPSHGSDPAIFRDEDGTFHLIYEDWSPVNPKEHHFDSPLAGHSKSPDGIHGFVPHVYPPPIDERTTPTGEIRSYEPHPTQLIEGTDLGPYEYEVHEPKQNAYGDYEMIKVGNQYYLFSDYVPNESEKTMRIGRWRSNDITTKFIWSGEIGENLHPDPTVGFAENKFYLITQAEHDFVSEGPWVDGVELRVGVDINGDDVIDNWSDYVQIKELYSKNSCYAKVVNVVPAKATLPDLEAAYGFSIQIRLHSKNGFFPVIDSMNLIFQEE